MQGIAQPIKIATPLEGAESPSRPPGPNPQLSLPTGPGALLRGGRSTRTDEDRDFLASAFKVRAGGVSATAIYRCLAYYASLSDRRIAYPSQSTIASYCDMSVRQVRRLLPKLEADGRIVCLKRKRGAYSSTYELARIGQDVLLEWDKVSYEEGREEERSKSLSLETCEAQVKAKPTKPPKKLEPLSGFPSPDPDPGASAPVAEEPVFVHPKQVGMLYSVARKLGKPISDEEALRFDDMPHEKKKWILDPMLATEQQASMEGLVPPPPPKLVPQFVVGEVRKSVKKPSQENYRHVWHGPDSDRLFVCAVCAEERGQIQVPARSGGDR